MTEDSFRIDKYFASGIGQLARRLDDDDDTLIRNIIYHVAESYEHSLFGYGVIDQTDFAKRWNYQTSNLRRRHPAPWQLNDMSREEVDLYMKRCRENPSERKGGDSWVWDTRFENALYILANKPMSFNSYRTYEADGTGEKIDRVMKENVTFTLFTRIQAVQRPRGKVVYTYILNPDFEQNLTSYYVRGARQSLIGLRGKELDQVYLYLVNLRANLAVRGLHETTPGEMPTFEYLCDLARVPLLTKDGAPYEQRRRKERLAAALDEIAATTEISFSVRWEREAGCAYPYVPVIDFGAESVPSAGMTQHIQKDENAKIYRQVIGIQLRDMYSRLHSTGTYSAIDLDDFNAWIFDVDRDRAEKETALKLAFIRIFGRIPFDESRRKAEFFSKVQVAAASPNPSFERFIAHF